MEKRIICAIKDSKSRNFNPPTVFDNEDAARRGFSTLVLRDKDTLVSTFPADFDLWKLGEFDVYTGIITPCLAPVHLANGVDFVKD